MEYEVCLNSTSIFENFLFGKECYKVVIRYKQSELNSSFDEIHHELYAGKYSRMDCDDICFKQNGKVINYNAIDRLNWVLVKNF